LDVVYSVNRVPIRLTEGRWQHITYTHDDLADYREECLLVLEKPDLVLEGEHGTLRAVKGFGRDRYLMVVYRELATEDDGFVITAYFVGKINRRKKVWPR
jgi:hypothetical protein